MKNIKKIRKTSLASAMLVFQIVFLCSPASYIDSAHAADTLASPEDAIIDSFVSMSQLSGYQSTTDLLNEGSAGYTVGNIYYLSTTGSDANSGSEANSWKTLQYAFSKLKAGDSLFIKEGTYQQTVNIAVSGTANAYINVVGLGKVIFDGSNLDSYDPIFDTKGNDYLRFINMEVNNARSLAHITTGSHHIEIENLVTHNTQFAVWMQNAAFVTIKNAYVTGSRFGFRGEGTTHDVTFENVETYYSKETTVQSDGFLNGDGFIFESDTYNLTFKNIISAYNSDAGLDIKGDNVWIENVISYGNTNGLKLWGTGVTVVNSLIYGSKDQRSPTGRVTAGVGINLRAGYTKVYNSTIVDNGSEVEVKATYGAQLHVENCIIARKTASGTLRTALGIVTSANVLWYRYGKTTPEFTLKNGDLWGNPNFVNWDSGNFRLMSSSMAINKGLANSNLPSYDLDFDNRLVGDKLDLGAYEYQPANQAPVMSILTNKSVSENSAISFSVSATDPDGDSLSYSALNLPAGATFNTNTGLFSWTPSYDQAGDYSLLFSVSDGQSLSQASMLLTVLNVNRLPVFQSVGDQTGKEGETMLFSVNANDPDGDLLTITAMNLPQGATFDTQTRVFSWTPSYTQAGSYSVVFRASDGSLSADKTIQLVVGDTVVTDPDGTPGEIVLVSSTSAQDYSAVSGTVYNYTNDVLAMYSNRTISYDLVMDAASKYYVNISTAQVTSKDVPYPGYLFKMNILVDGVVIATRDFSASKTFTSSASIDLGVLTAGTHRISFAWLNDQTGVLSTQDSNLGIKNIVLSKEVSSVVLPVNQPPVMPVLADVSTSEASVISFSVAAQDPDQDLLTYTALNLPSGASLDAQTGLFTWTPSYDQAGDYSLNFAVSDGLATAQASMLLTVLNVNRSPLFQNIIDQTGKEGDIIYFSVNANDPDGDLLTISAVAIPQGATFDTQTRVFSWTPSYTQAGSYSVVFRASDGNLSVDQTIQLVVADAVATDPDGTSSEIAIVSSTNAQDYSLSTGTVYKYTGDVLALYSNQTVTYDLLMDTNARYFVNLSTAQVTSKDIPYPGYLFKMNILVDGVVMATRDFSASKTFVSSPLIDLGMLSAGTHRVSFAWLNNQSGTLSTQDSNLGMKNIVLSKEVVTVITPDPTPSAPVLSETINTTSYSSSSDGVIIWGSDVLVMYSNQSVSYSMNSTQNTNYLIKLDTAQVTSKTTPSPDYRFNINVFVDGVLRGNYNLSATKEYVTSDFMDLGWLSAGAHTIRLDWKNDTSSATYDANLGMKNLAVYSGTVITATTTTDTTAVTTDTSTTTASPTLIEEQATTDLSATDPVIDTTTSALSPLMSEAVRFDGNGDYITLADSPDWDFGTGDFTIDFRIKFDRIVNGNNAIYVQGDNSQTFSMLRYEGRNQQWVFSILDQSIPQVTLAARDVLDIDTWYHLALVRYGQSWTIYRDGVSVGNTTANMTYKDYGYQVGIGGSNAGNTDYKQYLNGYLEEFRISKGIARWTSDFTPSTVAYEADSYTMLLMHMNDEEDSSFFNHTATLMGNTFFTTLT